MAPQTPQAAQQIHQEFQKVPERIDQITDTDTDMLGTIVHTAYEKIVQPLGVDQQEIRRHAPDISTPQWGSLPQRTRDEYTAVMAVTGSPEQLVPGPRFSQFESACQKVLPDMRSNLQRLGIR